MSDSAAHKLREEAQADRGSAESAPENLAGINADSASSRTPAAATSESPKVDPYRYMVLDRGKRSAIVFDRNTGKEITPQLSVKGARALVYALNHGEERAPATKRVLRALDLKRQGYSHGAIARMLGISVNEARSLVS